MKITHQNVKKTRSRRKKRRNQPKLNKSIFKNFKKLNPTFCVFFSFLCRILFFLFSSSNFFHSTADFDIHILLPIHRQFRDFHSFIKKLFGLQLQGSQCMQFSTQHSEIAIFLRKQNETFSFFLPVPFTD